MHNVRIRLYAHRYSNDQSFSLTGTKLSCHRTSLSLSPRSTTIQFPVQNLRTNSKEQERQLEFISFRWIERENEWKDGRHGGKKRSEDREQRSELSIKFAGRRDSWNDRVHPPRMVMLAKRDIKSQGWFMIWKMKLENVCLICRFVRRPCKVFRE